MKKISVVASILGAAFLLSGCGIPLNINLQTVAGSGKVTSEMRSVSNVRAVSLTGAGELVIQQTGTDSLTIETDDNLQPLIETTMFQGKLTIGFKAGSFPSRFTKLRYTLTVKSLESIELSGAGTITGDALTADKLIIDSSGAGKITVAGKVGDLTMNLSGAGSFDGEKMEAQTVAIKISGVGNAVVNAVKTLDATISGAGNIEYVGSPQVRPTITGAGSIKAKKP